jgi:hypothetical protein
LILIVVGPDPPAVRLVLVLRWLTTENDRTL